jgi:hypothetical protein
MAAADPVADAYAVAEISVLVTEKGDHIRTAVTGRIDRKGDVANRT